MESSPLATNGSDQENRRSDETSDEESLFSSPFKSSSQETSKNRCQDASQTTPRSSRKRTTIEHLQEDADKDTTFDKVDGGRVIEGYKKILTRLNDVEKDIRSETIVESSKKMNRMMRGANELATKAYNCPEATVVGFDGLYLERAGRNVNKITEVMEIDSKIFSMTTFLENLTEFLQGPCSTAL